MFVRKLHTSYRFKLFKFSFLNILLILYLRVHLYTCTNAWVPVSYTHLDVYKRQEYNNDNNNLWEEKIREIRQFQSTDKNKSPSSGQLNRLITIYNKYRHVFSDLPGKVKNYQCVLHFKEPVNFNRKSYPIAYSLKEAVRSEINQLIEDDIIAVSYTHLDVYKRQE